MLESNVAAKFKDAFSMFQLWIPSNRVAGWPDIGIQFGMSQFVWCELKVTTLRPGARILLDNLQKEQAAFLYKWQRMKGFCFVLAGLSDREANDIGYVIVRPFFYSQWLTVNKTLYNLDDLVFVNTMEDVRSWFQSTYVLQDRYARREVIPPSN